MSMKRRSLPTNPSGKVQKENTKDGSPSGIRTRLSTGIIQMNGTSTVHRESANSETSSQSSTASSVKESPAGVVARKRSITNALTDNMTSGGMQLLPPKKRKVGKNNGTGEDNMNDYFCWMCHKDGTMVCCELCPRVFHIKCLSVDSQLPNDWVCPECEKIMKAECMDTRSQAMSLIKLDTLCTLLKYGLERMKHPGSTPFQNPVNVSTVPTYLDYVFYPMDLTILEKNIKKKMYGSTEAFLADAKWILHNCIVFNGAHDKLTASAKMIIKICKHEMNEIEVCPDCYLTSCMKKTDHWFAEPCRTPHTLVWAKLKGYPFWPAKALQENHSQIDVRFFGSHDRAWVPVSQVYMLSKTPPTETKKSRGGFDESMAEIELHIKKIREKFGSFEYASFRTPYDKHNVYYHNKLKKLPKSPKRGKRKSPSHESSRRGFKNGKIVETKPSERQSAVTKTASALKNKYNTARTKKVTVYKQTAAGVFLITETKPCKDSLALSPTTTSKDIPKVRLPDRKILEEIESKIVTLSQEEDYELEHESKHNEDQDSDKSGTEHTNISASNSVNNIEENNSSAGSSCSKISDEKASEKLSPSSCEVADLKKNAESTPGECSDVGNMSDETASMDSNSENSVTSSPGKQEYADKLKRTIENCKAKLGLAEDSLLIEEEFVESEDEDMPEFKLGSEDKDKVDMVTPPASDNSSLSQKSEKRTEKSPGVSPTEDKLNESLDNDCKIKEHDASCIESSSNSSADCIVLTGSHTTHSDTSKSSTTTLSPSIVMGVSPSHTPMTIDGDKVESGTTVCKDNVKKDSHLNTISTLSSTEDKVILPCNEDSEVSKLTTKSVEVKSSSEGTTSTSSLIDEKGDVGNVQSATENEDPDSKCEDDSVLTRTVEADKPDVNSVSTEKQNEICSISSDSHSKDRTVAKSPIKENVNSQTNSVVCMTENSVASSTDIVKPIMNSQIANIQNKTTDCSVIKSNTEKSVRSNQQPSPNLGNNSSVSQLQSDVIEKNVVGETSPKSIHIDSPNENVDEHKTAIKNAKSFAETDTSNVDLVISSVASLAYTVEKNRSSDNKTNNKNIAGNSGSSLKKMAMEKRESFQDNRSLRKSPTNVVQSEQTVLHRTNYVDIQNKSENFKRDEIVVKKHRPVAFKSTTKGAIRRTTSNSGQSCHKISPPQVKHLPPPTSTPSPVNIKTEVKIVSPQFVSPSLDKNSDGGSVVGDDLFMEVETAVSDENPLMIDLGEEEEEVTVQPSPFIEGVKQTTCVQNMQSSPLNSTKETVTDTVSVESSNQKIVPIKEKPMEASFSSEKRNASTPPPVKVREICNKYSSRLVANLNSTVALMCDEISKEVQKNQPKPQSNPDMTEQIKKMKWEHQQELEEIRHNFQLTILEMQACWEAEKDRIIVQAKKEFQKEMDKTVAETKKKQWCAQCGKEAIFYCCWNTSYCDYPCQQSHWPDHMHSCMQANQVTDSAETNSEKTVNDNSQQQRPLQTKVSETDQSHSWVDKMREGLNNALQQQEKDSRKPTYRFVPCSTTSQPLNNVMQSTAQPQFSTNAQQIQLQYVQQQQLPMNRPPPPQYQNPPQMRMQVHIPPNQQNMANFGPLTSAVPPGGNIIYPVLQSPHPPRQMTNNSNNPQQFLIAPPGGQRHPANFLPVTLPLQPRPPF